MPEPLEGFLLAAGMGLRMGALSQCLPKPAWTLRGRPLLQWGTEAMRSEGITRLACNAHLWPERLRAVAEGIEVCEEPELLGSAGGLRHARGRVETELLSWNADVWAEAVPFGRLRAAHRQARATLSWLLIPHPGGPWNPVWMDEQDRVLPKDVVGPKGPFHFTGAAAWSPEALALLPEGPSEVNDLRPRLPFHLGVVVEPFAWREVGTADALIQVAAELAPDQEGRLPGCYVHPTALMPPGAADRLTRCVLGPGAAPMPSFADSDALWFEERGNQVRLGL
ncbi:MAG: NTP transferase domain-containing protein [Geothrix sp.]|uniref:NTP transferase domain-containing protein n=1 Tax=Geothrix sp. TaxID=1962974 RepID=UPI0017A28B54|nr:NTP transferase domain-containing protein [Geothrix sp.]NWJ41373.1 NTP transferase domain-containing protein [Geothrix sp.]WIL20640.1 MAG: NTP transferase domain-containing protein [Geothrix sp.]